MVNPKNVPDEELDSLIDPAIRSEIGNPCPVTFAATVVYAPLMVVGLVLSAFVTKTFPPKLDAETIAADFGIGLCVAAALVLVTYVVARVVPAFHSMEAAFRRTLGPLSLGEMARIAVLSGIAEELLFRGVIQPWLGLPAAAVIFGLLHFVPDRSWFPWTLFATSFGFIAGWLFEERGSLVAPIVAHVFVNLTNLILIVSGRRLPAPAAR